MRKKLVRHGNSRALVFDKTMLELLGIGEDDELEITIEGTEMQVRNACDPSVRDDAFVAAATRTLNAHSELFKRLSE